MKTVIINGSGGCGKDTFVGFCQDINPNVLNISTIDEVKNIAIKMGWDGFKREKDRKFLSDLKDLWEEYNHGPSEDVIKKTKLFKIKMNSLGHNNAVVFIHCREPQYIEKLKNELNAITLLIVNPKIPLILTNHADRYVLEYQYDYIIENDGTLNDLQKKADNFLNNIGCYNC